MPELPEVETIRRGLSKFIVHKTIKRVYVLTNKSLFFSDDLNQKNVNDVFKEYFLKTSMRVLGLRRFGKALIIDDEGGISMMIHLRMTGQLIWRGEENYAAGHPSENFVAELPNKQTRVIFEFKDGNLYFNDQRKFGFVKVLKTEDVEKEEFIQKLAKEPWEMSVQEFYDTLKHHKGMTIKAALLDQTIICGLGNIYADETLFDAKIHPETRVGDLTLKEIEKILLGARKVMQKSIDSGGSTMATYVKADGTRGDYLEKFAQVFRKEGQACPCCGTEIIKIRVAGRGTHICPKCQEKK